MASKYWLKLFHETIYDPKIMMRSPGARLRWYECLCLAGDIDRDGELPSIEHMVFVFRVSQEQLLDELSELVRAGMIVQNGDVYIVKNWTKRQSQMPDAERKYRDRDSKQKQEYYNEKVSETVTNSVRISDADIDIDKDKDIDKEQDTEERLISQFLKVTGQDYFPKEIANRTEWIMILEYLEKGGVTEEIMVKACEGQKVTHPSQIVKECTRYIREKERDEHKRKVG